MAVASVPDVGSSLQNLGIEGALLLAFVPLSDFNNEGHAGTPKLTQVEKVTNELVLDLYRFLNKHPECTFAGEKWPSQSPPTVKSMRLSVVRLDARFSKLKKIRNSTEKDDKILAFLSEEYHLPRVFMAKGELKTTQPLRTLNVTSTCKEGNEILKAVNVALCKELAKLKVETESLKDVKQDADNSHEKMYAIQERTIAQQTKDLEIRKSEATRECVRQRELEIQKKEIREIENLTKQIQKVSLWTTESEVEAGLAKLRTLKQKSDALKLQLKFRKKVLCQTHPDKTVFMYSQQKKAFSSAELKNNLLKLLGTPETQQPLSTEDLSRDPELLIYRRIEHQFSGEDGLVWYRGTVLGYCKESEEYRVVYDEEDEEYSYPLLEDMANGEVRIIEH